MKKLVSMLLVFTLAFSSVCCFATDVTTSDYNWYDNYSGETEYLNSYEEYEDLINGMDEQLEYKELYNQMIEQTIESYKEAERDTIYKAKVLEASEPQVYYGYYQYLYKSLYQTLKIEILEGSEKGKVVEDVNYILTGDTYGNLELPKVTEGMTIHVSLQLDDDGNVYTDENGSIYAYSSSIDSPVSRWGYILTLIIITAVLVGIYLGKPGLKMLVPILLIVDLIVLFMVPALFDGTNVMLLLGFIILMSTITICVLKLGLNSKTFVAILVSLVMSFMLVLLVYGFDSLAYMSGITYEATSFVESILPRVVDSEVVPVIDLHALNVATITLIAFFMFVPIVCETINVYEENKNKKKAYSLTVDKMKEHISDKLVTIVPILLALSIPKFIILLANKCSLREIVNSEILGSDIVRILFVVIAMVVASPLTAIAGKLLIDDEENR